MTDQNVTAQDFTDVKVGDTVHRMLAGIIPMDLVVGNVDDTLIHCEGGWMFERSTGFEHDPDLGFGSEYGFTGSYLVKEQT